MVRCRVVLLRVCVKSSAVAPPGQESSYRSYIMRTGKGFAHSEDLREGTQGKLPAFSTARLRQCVFGRGANWGITASGRRFFVVLPVRKACSLRRRASRRVRAGVQVIQGASTCRKKL